VQLESSSATFNPLAAILLVAIGKGLGAAS